MGLFGEGVQIGSVVRIEFDGPQGMSARVVHPRSQRAETQARLLCNRADR